MWHIRSSSFTIACPRNLSTARRWKLSKASLHSSLRCEQRETKASHGECRFKHVVMLSASFMPPLSLENECVFSLHFSCFSRLSCSGVRIKPFGGMMLRALRCGYGCRFLVSMSGIWHSLPWILFVFVACWVRHMITSSLPCLHTHILYLHTHNVAWLVASAACVYANKWFFRAPVS